MIVTNSKSHDLLFLMPPSEIHALHQGESTLPGAMDYAKGKVLCVSLVLLQS